SPIGSQSRAGGLSARARREPIFFPQTSYLLAQSPMVDPNQPPNDQQEVACFLAQGMQYAGIASQFAITLLVLGYLGSWFDSSKGWSPWGALSGIAIGMTIGVWSLLRQIERLEKKKKR